MNVNLLTEQYLELQKEAVYARLSVHLSKFNIVRNHMYLFTGIQIEKD